jgi:peroxiredoxin
MRRRGAIVAWLSLLWVPGAFADAACTATPRHVDLDIAMTTSTGAALRLSDFAGRVLLVDFWATWCAPCRIEVPAFVALQQQYADAGLSIVGISMDDAAPAIERFAARHGVNYPLVPGDAGAAARVAFGPLTGVPTSVLLDRDGRICHVHTGYTPAGTFDAEIRALLGLDGDDAAVSVPSPGGSEAGAGQ